MQKGLDYRFKIGKFKDKTVEQVCQINPDYIIYIHARQDIKLSFQFEVLQKCFLWQSILK